MTGKKFPLEKTEGEILIQICIPLTFVIKETVTFEKYIILQIKATFFFQKLQPSTCLPHFTQDLEGHYRQGCH